MHATTMIDLERFQSDHEDHWLFRGHRCPEWNLETSLERAARRCGALQQDYERTVWREFRRHAHSYLSRVPADTDTLEWLALMQHYGAPTRLLDFTESFWIALYVAFEDAESDCAVVALDRRSLKKKRATLDYNEVLRANIDGGAHADTALYEDVPFYTNDRLAIQKGIFVFSLNLQRKFHDLLLQNQKVFTQLTVSAELFPKIRKRLNDFNCNSRVLFPGIDGYGRYFRNPAF
jgi:hypothetical protein